MNKEHFNYSETFCDAVDIIVSERLKQLSYDVTKVCTIVDNTYKALGRYTVQEETMKYEAYTTDTNFAVGDSVLVVIPNGNYDMQKMILSKVVLDEDLTSSANYVAPLTKMLDFTGNIIDEPQEFSLLANHPSEMDKLIYSITWNNGAQDSYSDYTRMGVSVDFCTWLAELNAVSGNYGLMFYFYTQNSTVEDIASKTSNYSLKFDINDILGNPYDFESYTNQQKVFDISFLKDVTRLDIYFYQNKDFRDGVGKLIDHTANDESMDSEFMDTDTFNAQSGQLLNDNLFLNNLQIFLGYDVSEFNGDQLNISTNDSTKYSATYDTNYKNLLLKWIHKTEDNKYIRLDKDSNNIEIYWVLYDSNQTSQPIEHIVGKNWIQKNLTVDSLNPFNCILDINDTLVTKINVRVKAVGRIQQADGNWVQYESSPLEFTNQDPRVDQTTYDAAVSLTIECMDNSGGNYFKYNQNSEIINEGEGQGYSRQLHLKYQGQYLEESSSQDIKDIRNIRWRIPINTDDNNSFTMLNWDTLQQQNNITVMEDQNIRYITFSNITGTEGFELSYSISNTWFAENANNDIECVLTTKNGVEYVARKTLMFGKANSQGSNLSLILQYADNKNAYEVKTDNNNNVLNHPQITIEGLVYDLSGNLLSNDNADWTWKVIGTDDLQANSDFEISQNGTDKSKAVIYLKNTVTKLTKGHHYNIIVVTYNNGTNNPITAYLPIAIKTLNGDNPRAVTLDGARKVIYDSNGVASYYTNAYVLKNNEHNPINGITWELNPTRDTNNPHHPELKETADGNKALQANALFLKDYHYNTVITARSGSTIYWIQPILIMQSAYDFAILNEWNGTGTKYGDNYIVSSMVSAGKKHDDGTFSGILMGEISSEEGTPGNIGLYGISHGVNSFTLTDSGNVTFGYDLLNGADVLAHTDITFGTNNMITSYIDAGKQISLDIDDQYLDFNNGSNTSLFLSSGQRRSGLDDCYLHFKKNNGTILALGGNHNYLQSTNFSNTESTKTGLQLNLDTKTLIGQSDSKFQWRGDMILNAKDRIKMDTRDTAEFILQIGNLKIDKDGEVYYGDKTLADYIKSVK